MLSQRAKTAKKNAMKRQFEAWEPSGERSPTLEKLYQYLNLVKPSSVESERSFSTAGRFVTRYRASLSDKNFSTLVFLRHYFKSQKKKEEKSVTS